MEILNNANIIREKRRTLKLVINNDGSLTIFCPIKLPLKEINTLLKPKEELIQKKISQVKHNFSKNQYFYNYTKVLVLGKEYQLISSKSIKQPYFTDEELIIPEKYFVSDRLVFILKKVLKELSVKIICSRVDSLKKCFLKSYNYKDLLIGSFKSKWGSCDNFKIIKLNWKLVMLPQNLIDFVICHEMTHLKQLNHSKEFYCQLENVFPNSKNARKELKQYDFLLNIY